MERLLQRSWGNTNLASLFRNSKCFGAFLSNPNSYMLGGVLAPFEAKVWREVTLERMQKQEGYWIFLN